MSDASHYDANFYKRRHDATTYAATTVLKRVADYLPSLNSAVDYGCGSGTWLATLAEQHGTKDVLGFDGSWVAREHLRIPEERFVETNLNAPPPLQHRVDLAITLEVAEHLFADSAADFVKTLCDASDFILFSAAVPGQGGQHHVNEQWPDYWGDLFKARGYRMIDCLRGAIWNDADIAYWYRQNLFLVVNESRLGELAPAAFEIPRPLALVHPDLYLERRDESRSVKGAWKLLRRAIKRDWFNKDVD